MIKILNTNQMISICTQFLRYYDSRIVQHGERVAYICYKIYATGNFKPSLDLKTLLVLAMLHDIGAYKTDEIDRMLEFETKNVFLHSIYGYLFLKNFTPLGEKAEAILYHHTCPKKLHNKPTKMQLYAELINLADRIDIGLNSNMPVDEIYCRLEKLEFNKLLLDSVYDVLTNFDAQELKPNNIENWQQEILKIIPVSNDDAIMYLQMLIHTIDFKSETTVLHSISTVALSLFLASFFDYSENELAEIHLAALVHDIGKAATPNEILNYPGKLSPEKMEIMREHVVHTEKILGGILPTKIVNMASRHHEKLNGSGYPYGLTANQLSHEDRLIAVADIASALSSKRSYKESFDWERISSILQEMVDERLLDPHITGLILNNQTSMLKFLDEYTLPVLNQYQDMKNEFNQLLAIYN